MHAQGIDRTQHGERCGATASAVDFVARLAWADLAAEVRHAARRHLLDTIGVMIAGAPGAVATHAEAALAVARGQGDLPVPGRKRRADLLDAIFLAATAGHGIELDDGYRQGSVHPGVVVTPALLPFAAQAHLSGTALLEAMVAGYEVVLAVASAAHPALRLRGFHPTAASGVFGAAAGVGKLRGLSRPQLGDAFGIAASSAAGLFAFLAGGGDIKRLHAGHAAREGAFAVLLAEQGVAGPPGVLEGRDGFFQAFSEASRADGMSLPPVVPFAITDCYVKPYACCRHLQPAIEALITLMAEERLSAPDIESIDVDTYRIAAAHAHTGWSDFASAQLSFPFTMAVAARYGWIELDHFKQEVLSDPGIADIAARLRVTASEEVDRLYPGSRPARVTVTTTDGRSYMRQADEALGSASVPFDDDRLKDKFVALTKPVLGPRRTRRVLEQIWSIEEMTDVAPLIGELAL